MTSLLIQILHCFSSQNYLSFISSQFSYRLGALHERTREIVQPTQKAALSDWLARRDGVQLIFIYFMLYVCDVGDVIVMYVCMYVCIHFICL